MRGPKRQLDVVVAPVMRSSAMRGVDKVLRAVAPKDVTVTLIGESGVGKEVLARRVHELSARREGPFVPINCAAIPESLFESELFGYEKGAFTGATARTRGKIEAAQAGTLFLDEIVEMPLAMQAKLLRFLENRRFTRVGGTVKVEADVRLVVATLRSLEEEVRAGRFRADLFYRIQGITIRVPPLRERKADLGPLLAQFIAQFSVKHGSTPPRLTREVRAALLAYDWPGNVRELRNTVEMLCLLRGGRQVRVRDLPEALQRVPAARAASARPPPEGTLTVALDEPLDRIIEQVIDAVLAQEQGNRSRAAGRLGISIRTVQRHAARSGGAGSGT